eukprot:TRINITY_DN9726_c0_g1_i1.p1 TRINITY_DN9726_c0_g1~~TRINITY_DN9726_c0_g1_i1.p1  ORF type:complete len:371 (-),score=66.97 TRINITY_DN9726_c0_g1_i1:206-1318(-)
MACIMPSMSLPVEGRRRRDERTCLIKKAKEAEATEVDDDDVSTDGCEDGSNFDYTSSSGSSSGSQSNSASETEDAAPLSVRGNVGPLGFRRRTLAAPQRNRKFRGTPLETIPGTPVNIQGEIEFHTAAMHADVTGDRSPKRRPRPAALSTVVTATPAATALPLGPFGTSPVTQTSQTATFAGRTTGGMDPLVSSSPMISSQSVTLFSTTPTAPNSLAFGSPMGASFLGTVPAVPTAASAPVTPQTTKPTLAALPLKSSAPVGRSFSEPLAPHSPIRRAREAVLNSAKESGIPLKVRLPPHVPRMQNLDPAKPVKKRPVLGDHATNIQNEELRRRAPENPIKKRVASFILADPPKMLINLETDIALPPGLW